VIGHFIADLPVAGEGGVRPYVFVERLDETLERLPSTAAVTQSVAAVIGATA
jgi:hypothetical protein